MFPLRQWDQMVDSKRQLRFPRVIELLGTSSHLMLREYRRYVLFVGETDEKEVSLGVEWLRGRDWVNIITE